MASASGVYSCADTIVSLPKMASSIETQQLKEIEWIRNRRLELEALILYERRKSGHQNTVDEEEEEEASSMDFDVIQPKLEDAVYKDAISANTMKNLQLSDMLEKIVMSTLDVSSSGGPEKLAISDVQQKFGDLMDDNLETAKKIVQEHETICKLIRENMKKELLLSKMAHERHALMEKYWKKKGREDRLQAGIVTERVKQLEAKVNSAIKALTVHNHILQLVTAYSGLDWSKDAALLSTITECGKPVDEQLSSVQL